MIDFVNVLFEFSRTHCVAICAALVPMNLLATLQTLVFAGVGRPIAQVDLMAKVSSLYALLLLLHVVTWLAIGVIMAPTYILTFLGGLCLLTNLVTVAIVSRGNLPKRLIKLVELG
jgi:hypothetical protein